MAPPVERRRGVRESLARQELNERQGHELRGTVAEPLARLSLLLGDHRHPVCLTLVEWRIENGDYAAATNHALRLGERSAKVGRVMERGVEQRDVDASRR